MKEIKAYQCDYCRKYSKSKKYMKRHESECYYNPATRSCGSCANLNVVEMEKEHGVFISRPICAAGLIISEIDPTKLRGYILDLRTHCPLWKQRITEEEEED